MYYCRILPYLGKKFEKRFVKSKSAHQEYYTDTIEYISAVPVQQ